MTDTRTRPPRAQSRDWFRMSADTDLKTAQVYLYDAIDPWWGVTASDFVRSWAALDVDRIDLFINSPGGDVFDGLAILNAIRRTEAHVTAHIDGLAASAASFIAMGADEIVMSRNSELMIHDAAGLCWGNAADMATMTTDLDRVSDNIASIYHERAGGSPADWRDLMRAETWYTADEAVEAGLADRVDTKRDKSDVKNRLDLSIFAHAGRANAPAPTERPAAAGPHPVIAELRYDGALEAVYAYTPTSVAARADGGQKPPAEPVEPIDSRQEGPDTMSDTITKGLIDRLGITDAEVDDQTLLNALDEALAERAAPAPQNTITAPEGTALIDEDQLAQLRADAAAGAKARAEQVQARRVAIVDTAIQEGRIAPARRDAWLKQLDADEEGATATINTLEPGTIPLAPKGFTGGALENNDDDALYSRAWPTQKEA